MESMRNSRLMSLSLTAVAVAMGVLIVCERFQQVPVIPLRDGRVILRDGSVLIQNAGSETDHSTTRW